jgi:hypothetical protein
MSLALEEFFAAVADEFGVALEENACDTLSTPGEVIDYVADSTAAADGMTPDEHRDHVASVVGELMAQTLGVTRYGEGSRFVQDLHVR